MRGEEAVEDASYPLLATVATFDNNNIVCYYSCYCWEYDTLPLHAISAGWQIFLVSLVSSDVPLDSSITAGQ